MDLTSYVDNLRHELAVAAEAGGEDARALAERLTAPLDSAVRLVLLDALSAAAAEITRDLAPGSVDLRLRGREPSFVVTPPPADHSFEEPGPSAADVPPPVSPEGDEGATARSASASAEYLKGRTQRQPPRSAQSTPGSSARAVAALESDDRGRRSDRRAPRAGQRYTGWVR
jgi:hypothetical protein